MAGKYNVRIGGVDFQISKLNPQPEDGSNWLVVHPAAIKAYIDPLDSLDTQNVDPRDWSASRGKAVVIAGGTDPEGGLDEDQAKIARKVSELVASRFSQDNELTVQRYVPGTEEPTPYDLDNSQETFISVPKLEPKDSKSFLSSLGSPKDDSMEDFANKALLFLKDIARKPLLLEKAEEKTKEVEVPALYTSQFNKTKKPALRHPSRESVILDVISEIVKAKAPSLTNEHADEFAALVGALTKYVIKTIEKAPASNTEKLAARPRTSGELGS